MDVLTAFPRLEPLGPASRPHPGATRPETAPEFFLGLSATFTADPLLDGLNFWFRELGVAGEIEVAPYGQVLQTLLSPGGGLSGRPGMHVVLLRLRDWLRELPEEHAASPEFLRDYLGATAGDLERAMRTHRAQAAAETLVVFCPSSPERKDDAEPLLEQTEATLVAQLSALPGVTVVRARDFHALYEVDDTSIADFVREHIAHIPYQARYFHTLATIVMRHVHRKLAPARKVVVVDCDNTLWRGVVGEVGAEGLLFDAGHAALHGALARLGESGVLIGLCSKNEEPDVWRVFETRGADFTLRRDQIVSAAINWQPKSANLRAMAARLNLGLDSFVFVDDNPVECAEVRAACPEVLVIEWPQEPDRAVRLLAHCWELDPRGATAEDRRRTELYKEEFKRQELQAQTLTFKDFIASLDLVVDVAPLAPDDLKRASQLTLRTNQFNFTTKRRDEGELQALAASGTHEIRTVRVRDRFGDYGLVGLLIAERREGEVFADTFLLSCRVLGRGVEHAMLAELGQIAQAHGLRSVRLRVEPTKRNTPARNFVESAAPPEYVTVQDGVIEAVMPADVTAAMLFEPPEQAGPAVMEESSSKAAPVDAGRLRSREAQIRRTAFELATPDDLTRAIEGRSATATTASTAAVDDSIVYDAFAAALKMPPGRVKEIDSLEALGCDSFKIVEITVALLEKVPALPGTLLFEHRTVSEIAKKVIEIAGGTPDATRPAPAASPATGPADARGTRDIAVVGMHLRTAGASSPAELWSLLSTGGVAVRPVPEDRGYFLGRLDDTRPHFAGLLDDVDRFDAELFGITPREAELMDPQLRLFLEVAWGALEDAGCLGDNLESQTGVFAGVMYGDYAYRANLVARHGENPFKSWEGFSLANRLSQVFDFRGPSVAVDTACSSSGTALHLACRALADGDCRVAVAGGVNLILDPDRFVQLGRLGILSESGRCLAFGAEADGTVLGEGAGVVVLRPVADALARGDRIYGVIKATGVSTGSGTVGFTAPNPVAQAEAIRRAVRASGIDPRTISYVETHGTGTALGDPIEVRGLAMAYGDRELWDPAVEGEQACTLGSIKPNIGHLEAGAGVLGLIKVLLQMQHRQLLPSVTSELPNPQIPFAQSPFDIQRTLAPWEPPALSVNGTPVSIPRRAALNSFGVGGANAHVVIEEPPALAATGDEPAATAHYLMPVAARSGESLAHRLEGLAAALESDPALDPQDACWTLATGQRPLAHRSAVAARSRQELIDSLRKLAAGDEPTNASTSTAARHDAAPRVAFLFTGQGSQYAGMGRDLYDSQPVFRQALDRCFELFAPLLDDDLRGVMFAGADAPDAARLNQTGFTQPALFSLGYALAALWRSWGVTPAAVMGHSIGEITAMCIAGGLSLEDAVRMVAARGRLMQALPPGGGMTSVMANEARVAEAIADLADRVAIAAINAPQQIVVSGEATAVATVTARVEAEGVRTKPLVVSHAFHSPLMRPMLAEYESVLRQVRFSEPETTFVSCVLGRVAGEEVTTVDYWLRNVSDTVRFTDGAQAFERLGIRAFVELGPQPILLGMARQCIEADEARLWLPSIRKDGAGAIAMLASAGQLWTAGGAIDWDGFYAPFRRRRVTLPAYPFAGRRYWIREVPDMVRLNPADVVTHSSVGSGFSRTNVASGFSRTGAAAYEIAWRPAALGPVTQPQLTGSWLVVADALGVSSSLANGIEAAGARAVVVTNGNDPEAALRELAGEGARDLRGVLYLRGLDTSHVAGTQPPRAGIAATDRLLTFMRTVNSLETADLRLWVVTRHGVEAAVDPDIPLDPAQACLWGAGRTFALEHPERWGGLIDLPPGMPAELAASSILETVSSVGADDQFAVRREGRFVPRLVRRRSNEGSHFAVAADKTYLVTGGLGALGLHTAGWLVARGARHLVLTSRGGARTPEAIAAVKDLEAQGATVTFVAADVSTPAGVSTAMDAVTAPLGGIFHAAGVDDTRAIADMAPGDADAVMAGKATGAWLLHDRTQYMRLDAFVLFSSIASVLGSANRSAYAAANAFLDTLAHERRRMGLAGTSLNWGPWAGGGMATESAIEQYGRAGNRGIVPAEGLALMDALLGAGTAQAAVADIDWTAFRTAYEARRDRPFISELIDSSPAPAEVPDRSGRTPAATPWVAALTALESDARLGELSDLLRAEIAQTLGFESAADVAVDRPFRDMGMDSLMSADFAQRLQKRLGIKSTALLFEHPTVAQLAPQLLAKLEFSPAAPATVPTAVTTTAPPAALPAPVADDTAPPAASAGRTEGYRPGVEREVFAFQQQAWPDRRPDWIGPRWRWMFVESARRLGLAPRVWLHRRDGGIVGHNGAIPVRLRIGPDELPTAWLVDTMVLEAYRAEGLGARLMVEAHEDMPFALSLGQTAQMRAIQLRLGWHQVAPLETAMLMLRPERVLRGKMPGPAAFAAGLALRATDAVRGALKTRPAGQVRAIAGFDASHDRIWEAMAADVTCAVRRDASYLNWKYVHQPGQDFLRLEVTSADGARGIVVLSFRPPDSAYAYRRAFIVDIVGPISNAGLMADILHAVENAASERAIDAVLCLHVGPALTMALQNAGYRVREPSRYLLVRPGALEGLTRERLLSAGGWFVTQGDSDIDRPW